MLKYLPAFFFVLFQVYLSKIYSSAISIFLTISTSSFYFHLNVFFMKNHTIHVSSKIDVWCFLHCSILSMVSGESMCVCFSVRFNEIIPVLMSRAVVTELADQNSLVSSVRIPCKFVDRRYVYLLMKYLLINSKVSIAFIRYKINHTLEY